MYQIGIDEAGYGPNLGPLVIGGCLWRGPKRDDCLYRLLRRSVCTEPGTPDKITVCDSKILHQATNDLARLETNLFPFLFGTDQKDCEPWPELLRCLPDVQFPLASEFEAQQSFFASSSRIRIGRRAVTEAFFVQDGRRAHSPDLDLHKVAGLRSRLLNDCERQGVACEAVQGLCIMPAEFNALVETFGNKSTVLTIGSLLLVETFLQRITGTAPIRILCDKHGGRNHYRTFLEKLLQAHDVEILCESTEESTYRFGYRGSPVEISFTAKGENHFPTALSSMFAKYIREILMGLWNDYWVKAVDGLEPTKGYPVDAARFYAQIKPHLRARKIDDELVWRSR